jgi:quercetin dioxygenase-like cupin family protein
MSPFTSIAILAAFPYLIAGRSSLYVDVAPDHVRPYVIEHYAPAQAVSVGQQVYRFPVTGLSSGGAFSVLSTSMPGSSELGVLPHIHRTHHENFFCLKGRYQLWAEDQARVLEAGDFGTVPRNTTHTFQILAPDTEMIGVISPGGFEDLFFFLASANYSSSTWSPYAPAPPANGSGSPPPEIISSLESFDVYAQLQYNPRRDLVNGSAGAIGWHAETKELPEEDGTPYFVAKDYGPKYLYRDGGYQVIQPWITPATSQNEFTQGSITSTSESLP